MWIKYKESVITLMIVVVSTVGLVLILRGGGQHVAQRQEFAAELSALTRSELLGKRVHLFWMTTDGDSTRTSYNDLPAGILVVGSDCQPCRRLLRQLRVLMSGVCAPQSPLIVVDVTPLEMSPSRISEECPTAVRVTDGTRFRAMYRVRAMPWFAVIQSDSTVGYVRIGANADSVVSRLQGMVFGPSRGGDAADHRPL